MQPDYEFSVAREKRHDDGATSSATAILGEKATPALNRSQLEPGMARRAVASGRLMTSSGQEETVGDGGAVKAGNVMYCKKEVYQGLVAEFSKSVKP